MSDDLIVGHDGDVIRITINRPDDANRTTEAMLGQLGELLSNDARLIVLRGAGHTFSSGLAGRSKPPNEAYDFRAGFDPLFKLHETFHRCRAPVLTVVEGKAIGFGATLVAASDVVIAADDARFCLPETAHKILPTTAMARMIGAVSDKALAYMALSAEEFGAKDALAAGLVSLALPAAVLDAHVEDFIAKIKRIPKPAVYAIKEFIRAGRNLPRESLDALAANLHATVNSYSGMRA
ncbi:MAG TPA: enoyl-CoA hydratase/isomerase family protein [Stellaceae bacterium]|jgi:enoyl-CoA hydratase|nr:enoyl-CoA hydratase/isomerase family protein [Stellaceae bacterium]